ncbi:MAG: glycosyltransferase [Burkholderiales bacterium]|nr:glycosyltransferase [Burkholderiales bacterium]
MSRAPRVLLLCERLDIAGGVERFVCALAGHLAGQGLAVAVGSVGTPREQLRYPLAPAVRVLHRGLPLPAGDGAWPLLRRQWRVGRALARLIREESPDAVLLNGLTTACSVLLFAPPADAARCIACDHNHFGARSRPWQRLRAWLYRDLAAVVSLTRADAPRFAALNPGTEVIVNASSLRADAPARPAGETVLAVARHVAQKGLDLMLQAWVAVAAARPAARLLIVGDGPLQGALQRQAQALGIAGSVQWRPPTPDIEPLYRAAAVFVLPSRYEGMPLALLEAQALGVPAVAFDCPTGPAEIVTPETGLVVPAGDVPALAQALAALLADPGRRARMGAAAIERSRTHFSPELHYARWTALVQRVAAQRALPG